MLQSSWKKVRLKVKNLLYFYILIGFLFKVQGYIPSPDIILSRLNQNQGTRNYKIFQEVTFLDHSSLKNSLKFKEEWWRLSNHLFVNVIKDSQTIFSFSYKNFKKSWINEKNQKVSEKKNYIENYFFLKPKLPSWLSLVKRIHLERALGVVNYVFYLNKKNPTLWIEQDEFVIRKVRIQEDSWLTAEDYQLYLGQFLFPHKRTFLAPGIKVEMKVLNIQPVSSKESIPKHSKLIPLQEDNEFVNQFYYQVR